MSSHDQKKNSLFTNKFTLGKRKLNTGSFSDFKSPRVSNHKNLMSDFSINNRPTMKMDVSPKKRFLSGKSSQFNSDFKRGEPIHRISNFNQNMKRYPTTETKKQNNRGMMSTAVKFPNKEHSPEKVQLKAKESSHNFFDQDLFKNVSLAFLFVLFVGLVLYLRFGVSQDKIENNVILEDQFDEPEFAKNYSEQFEELETELLSQNENKNDINLTKEKTFYEEFYPNEPVKRDPLQQIKNLEIDFKNNKFPKDYLIIDCWGNTIEPEELKSLYKHFLNLKKNEIKKQKTKENSDFDEVPKKTKTEEKVDKKDPFEFLNVSLESICKEINRRRINDGLKPYEDENMSENFEEIKERNEDFEEEPIEDKKEFFIEYEDESEEIEIKNNENKNQFENENEEEKDKIKIIDENSEKSNFKEDQTDQNNFNQDNPSVDKSSKQNIQIENENKENQSKNLEDQSNASEIIKDEDSDNKIPKDKFKRSFLTKIIEDSNKLKNSVFGSFYWLFNKVFGFFNLIFNQIKFFFNWCFNWITKVFHWMKSFVWRSKQETSEKENFEIEIDENEKSVKSNQNNEEQEKSENNKETDIINQENNKNDDEVEETKKRNQSIKQNENELNLDKEDLSQLENSTQKDQSNKNEIDLKENDEDEYSRESNEEKENSKKNISRSQNSQNEEMNKSQNSQNEEMNKSQFSQNNSRNQNSQNEEMNKSQFSENRNDENIRQRQNENSEYTNDEKSQIKDKNLDESSKNEEENEKSKISNFENQNKEDQSIQTNHNETFDEDYENKSNNKSSQIENENENLNPENQNQSHEFEIEDPTTSKDNNDKEKFSPSFIDKVSNNSKQFLFKIGDIVSKSTISFFSYAIVLPSFFIFENLLIPIFNFHLSFWNFLKNFFFDFKTYTQSLPNRIKQNLPFRNKSNNYENETNYETIINHPDNNQEEETVSNIENKSKNNNNPKNKNYKNDFQPTTEDFLNSGLKFSVNEMEEMNDFPNFSFLKQNLHLYDPEQKIWNWVKDEDEKIVISENEDYENPSLDLKPEETDLEVDESSDRSEKIELDENLDMPESEDILKIINHALFMEGFDEQIGTFSNDELFDIDQFVELAKSLDSSNLNPLQKEIKGYLINYHNLKKMKNDIISVNSDLNPKKKANKNLGRDIDRIDDELMNMKMNSQDIENELENAKKEKKNTKNDLINFENEYTNELAPEIKENKKKIQQMKEEEADLMRQIDELNKKSENNRNNEIDEADLEKLKKLMEDLKNDVNSQKYDLDDENEKNLELKEKVNKYSKLLALLRIKLSKLKEYKQIYELAKQIKIQNIENSEKLGNIKVTSEKRVNQIKQLFNKINHIKDTEEDMVEIDKNLLVELMEDSKGQEQQIQEKLNQLIESVKKILEKSGNFNFEEYEEKIKKLKHLISVIEIKYKEENSNLQNSLKTISEKQKYLETLTDQYNSVQDNLMEEENKFSSFNSNANLYSRQLTVLENQSKELRSKIVNLVNDNNLNISDVKERFRYLKEEKNRNSLKYLDLKKRREEIKQNLELLQTKRNKIKMNMQIAKEEIQMLNEQKNNLIQIFHKKNKRNMNVKKGIKRALKYIFFNLDN